MNISWYLMVLPWPQKHINLSHVSPMARQFHSDSVGLLETSSLAYSVKHTFQTAVRFNSHWWSGIAFESQKQRFSIPTTDPAIPKNLCAHNSWHTSVETYSWHGYAKWSPSPDGKKSNHACWKADSLSPLAQSCKILVSCQASITNET